MQFLKQRQSFYAKPLSGLAHNILANSERNADEDLLLLKEKTL
jgi:hypothetical protein